MEKVLRFGIVGAGGIAGSHAGAIAAIPGAQLVAVCSRSQASAERFSAAHNCEYELSLEALLARSDTDAIAITAPSGVHSEIGIAAARAGKHVLCEKPLDISLEKIDALIKCCEENDVRLGVIYPLRFGAGAQAVKRAVQAGRFGRLVQSSVYIQWFRGEAYYSGTDWRGTWRLDGGGALMNQGVHSVDLLTWLVGDVTEVSGLFQTRVHGNIEVEDSAVAWLRFAHGGCGVVQASTCCYPGESRRLEIKGERGSVTLLDDKPIVWEFDEAQPEDDEVAALTEGAPAGDGHTLQYADFVEAVFAGRPLAVEGTEGRRAVAVVNAIYESSRRGAPVKTFL